MESILTKILHFFGKLDSKSRRLLIHQLTAIIQKPIMMRLRFFSYFRVSTETINNQ